MYDLQGFTAAGFHVSCQVEVHLLNALNTLNPLTSPLYPKPNELWVIHTCLSQVNGAAPAEAEETAAADE